MFACLIGLLGCNGLAVLPSLWTWRKNVHFNLRQSTLLERLMLLMIHWVGWTTIVSGPYLVLYSFVLALA